MSRVLIRPCHHLTQLTSHIQSWAGGEEEEEGIIEIITPLSTVGTGMICDRREGKLHDECLQLVHAGVENVLLLQAYAICYY